MRHLRAAIASLLLLLLTAGLPLTLAATIGNPVAGWEGLRVGDLSDQVVLDVLAAITWIAWATFAWSVLIEILTLLTHTRVPRLPGTLPGPQHLAHALVTAAFLILPTAPLATTSQPTTATAYLADTTAPDTAQHAGPPQAPAPSRPHAPVLPLPSRHPQVPASGARTAPAHRALPARTASSPVPSTSSARLSSTGFAAGAGAGLVTGVTLREIARLRRRQWRHRRPGRAVTAIAPQVARLEQKLRREGREALSDSDLMELLSAYATTGDEPMGPARGTAAWDAFIDAAGAVRAEFLDPAADLAAVPRPDAAEASSAGARASQVRPADPAPAGDGPPAAGAAPPGRALAALPEPDPAPGTHRTTAPPEDPSDREPALSLLAPPRGIVLKTTASTARDVQTLAPRVPARLRRLAQDADPDLDADLTDWHAAHTPRPRLAVLGAVTARASGELPAPRPRIAWHTEVFAYLAAHSRGVTPDKFGADLWPNDPDITSKPKLRQAIWVVRRWLGTNPLTGQEYLPQAKTSEGTAFYRLEPGILTDADLVRRLRLRAATRGSDGIGDLETALTLVTGPPYDPSLRRRGGYEWLTTDTPVDTECLAMIVDVAHVLATHYLGTGRPDLADRAARVSLTAGSRQDIPLLDLVAACDAQGRTAEAGHWVKMLLSAYDAEVEEDLPPRTAAILHRRQRRQVG